MTDRSIPTGKADMLQYIPMRANYKKMKNFR